MYFINSKVGKVYKDKTKDLPKPTLELDSVTFDLQQQIIITLMPTMANYIIELLKWKIEMILL